MIVYHCSLSIITDFIYNEKGVHFGGKQSAIEAALRKTEKSSEKIYIHKCELKSEDFFDCEDKGNHVEWVKTIKHAISEGFSAIRYTNRYEPDFEPSYVVLKSDLISILSVSVMTAKKAEDQIMDYFY